MHFGIIAAGDGSRLQQEGVAKPKPLVELHGEPMIGRLIRIMIATGAESVSVIVNEHMTEVADYLRSLSDKLSVPLQIVMKTTPSSMHSFYELSSLMRGKGRFVLTTVDTIFRQPDFERYVKAFAQAATDIDGMMGVTAFVDDEKPLWVGTDASDNITGFLDERADDTKYVSGGIYGLAGKAIDVLRQCIDSGVSRMRNYQRALIAAGLHLKAYPLGKIVDVDHVSDIAGAESFINTPAI